MDLDFKRDIILENERVLIRPMEEGDKAFFKNFLLDQVLTKYSIAMVTNEAEALAYVDACLEDRKKEHRYPFIFFDKKTNNYAGTSCFGNVVNPHKRLEIGWTKLGKAFRGAGLNAHCKFLFLKFAFETLDFNRVELKAHSENIRSRKAMEKIGAQFEGTLRSHFITYDGSLRDSVYYSFIKEEWPEVKIKLQKLMGV